MASVEGIDRAPSLPLLSRPWFAWPLAVLWAALFAASLAALTASAWLQASGRAFPLQPGTGVSWSPAEFGFVSTHAGFIPFSDEASRSGLRSGDILLAIDSRAPRDVVDLTRLGPSIRLTVRSPDGRISQHRVSRAPAHLQQLFAGSGLSPALDFFVRSIVVDVASIGLIAAAAFLFVRGRRRRLPLVLSFACLLTDLPLFNEPLVQWLDSSNAVTALFNAINSEGVTLFVIGMLLFPDDHFVSRWVGWFSVALIVVTALVGIAAQDVFFAIWRPIHMCILLAAACSLVVRYRRFPAGTERQQIQWGLFGFVAGVVAMAPAIFMSVLMEPTATRPAALVWSRMIQDVLLSVGIIAIAGGLLVSLLKYRLYDAGAAISRSVSIGALTVALLATFAGSEKIIELLGEQYFGHSIGVLAGGIGAALAAVLLVPLHHRLSHWAEHKFQKQLIHLRHGLPLLVGDMRETAPVSRIAAATLDAIGHGVRASRAALVFEGELLDARGIAADEVESWRKGWAAPLREGFDIDKADPLFPLRVPLEASGHGRIGWLLLGPRPDGSFYGKDERETLADIADPVARALEIAAARERREEEQRTINIALLRASEESIRVFGEVARKLDQLLAPPGIAAE